VPILPIEAPKLDGMNVHQAVSASVGAEGEDDGDLTLILMTFLKRIHNSWFGHNFLVISLLLGNNLCDFYLSRKTHMIMM
jgi:hypothetical protein